MPAKYYPNREEAETAATKRNQMIYWTENGKQKKAPNPKYQSSSPLNSTAPTNQPFSSPIEPVSIVVERAEADQQDRKPIKGEKQYRDFLLQSLGVTSLLIGLLICWAAILPMAMAEELAFTSEEVESFAIPGARLLAKSNIPEQVKTNLVNSGDYIGLGTAAVAYVYRVLETMKLYKGGGQDNGSTRKNPIISKTPEAVGGNNGYTATVNAGQLSAWGNFTAG